MNRQPTLGKHKGPRGVSFCRFPFCLASTKQSVYFSFNLISIFLNLILLHLLNFMYPVQNNVPPTGKEKQGPTSQPLLLWVLRLQALLGWGRL